MSDERIESPFGRLKPPVSVVIGALFLLFPAFNNRFPFLYADTATYMWGGFNGYVSDFRPITYGLFIRHVSLMESLWLVVFVQALLVSGLIHLFFRVFSTNKPGFKPLAVTGALAVTTHIGTSVGMLMPDFFAAAMVLAVAIFLYGKTLRRWDMILCGLVVWLALSSHFSHHYILLVILLTLAVRWAWLYFRKQQRVPWGRLSVLYGLMALAYFTIPTLHYLNGSGFRRDKASHVFLVGRINQMGLLKPFLDEHCGKTGDWNLCAYKDSLPDDFLWNGNSPVYRTGGWAANEAEYNRFLGAFFHSPMYLRKFAIKSFETAAMQFFNYEGEIVFKEREGSPPYNSIREGMPDQLSSVRLSKQYWEMWDNKVLDVVQRFLVMAGFLLLLYLLWAPASSGCSALQVRMIGFLLLALAANALICGGVSMVDMRFQARVIWLAPLFAIWLVLEGKPWPGLIRK